MLLILLEISFDKLLKPEDLELLCFVLCFNHFEIEYH